MSSGRSRRIQNARPGQVRIIGGRHRSRKLRFPAVRDLRPSPDAARETLFNWLMEHVKNSTCLDLFAGSGALGFEAISRGALGATLVESNRAAAEQLVENADLLGEADNITVFHGTASRFLATSSTRFDIVFLDPPYQRAMLEETVTQLINRKRLRAGALIYMETDAHSLPLPIPSTWHIIREAEYGLVKAFLVRSS